MSNNLSDNNTVAKIKLVLIGNSAAGKTCIVQRMVNNIFNVNNSSTIGAAYMMYSINKNLKIEMWDTAGQERFYSLLPMYARGAEVIIIVIDIEKSVEEQFVKWSKYIEDNKKLFSPHFKLFLIFNKYDLTSPQVESASFIFPALGLKTVTSTNLAKISPYSVGLRNYRQYFTNSDGNYCSGVDLTFFLHLPNTDLGNKTFTYC